MTKTIKRLSRPMCVLLLAAAILPSITGCGKKGDPKPPSAMSQLPVFNVT